MRALLVTLGVLAAALAPRAAAPIPVMILDGESGGPYHDWARVTALLERVLDETGLFEVEIVTAPAAGGACGAVAPDFGRHRAGVLHDDAPVGRGPAALKWSTKAATG
jgi:hypothetical protein